MNSQIGLSCVGLVGPLPYICRYFPKDLQSLLATFSIDISERLTL